jgi:hypothetical protein
MINIDRFGISTSSPLQGTKNPEEAYASKVEWEKGPNEKKIRIATKKITKDEENVDTELLYITACYK